MPIYNFRNKKTGEITERFMKIAEMEKTLVDETDLELTHLEAPPIGDVHKLGIKKAPAGFRDLLSQIKRKHYKSTIRD